MADPLYASVVLLAINDNKANGTTVFADQSPAARTLTANGNISYSSATAPTGMTTSGASDGTGDYLTAAQSTDFDLGSGDFTIECMIRFSTVTICGLVAKDDVTNRSWYFAAQSGTLRFNYYVGGTPSNYAPAWTPSTGVWYHVATCRSGNTIRNFVNGTQVGAGKDLTGITIDSVSGVTSVSALGNGASSVNGNISNVRVTKAARYTADFTPPTLPLELGATAPVADFTGTPTSGTTPLSVTFTDASTNTPTSWLWDFGDSTTSTSQNPTHVYSAAGTYTVALTATNAGGSNQNTKTGYITVTAASTGVPLGGKGDNIYKPSGLTYRKKEKKEVKDEAVEARIAESEQIRAEVTAKVAREFEEGALLEARRIEDMTQSQVNAEIAMLLQKKMRTQEEETTLILLMVAAVA